MPPFKVFLISKSIVILRVTNLRLELIQKEGPFCAIVSSSLTKMLIFFNKYSMRNIQWGTTIQFWTQISMAALQLDLAQCQLSLYNYQYYFFKYLHVKLQFKQFPEHFEQIVMDFPILTVDLPSRQQMLACNALLFRA